MQEQQQPLTATATTATPGAGPDIGDAVNNNNKLQQLSFMSKLQDFWSSFSPSVAIQTKLTNLKIAEQALLDLAPTFDYDYGNVDPHFPDIAIVDTHIPKSAVHCRNHERRHAKDMLYNNKENNNDSYIIHGIHIHSNSKPKSDDSLNASSQTLSPQNSQHPQQPPHQSQPQTIKTPLVMLHGYMNGGIYYYRNFFTLSRYFQSIYSLDMLGWGASSRPPFDLSALKDNNSNNNKNAHDEVASLSTTSTTPTTEMEMNDNVMAGQDFFVESLEAWRKQNGIDRMILAGHSMGGYIGTAYCEKYPNRVERLILISPVGVPEEPSLHEIMGGRYVQWRKTIMGQLFLQVFQYSSVGQILRLLPSSSSLERVRSYVGKRLQFENEKEQQVFADYLYHSNTLPGSGEYCLAHFLKPSSFAHYPLVHRIPKLVLFDLKEKDKKKINSNNDENNNESDNKNDTIQSVSFLYGQDDWMDVKGGLQVLEKCSGQNDDHVDGNNKSNDNNNDKIISVYSVSKAGHLLMLDNPKEFSHAVVLAAGGTIHYNNNDNNTNDNNNDMPTQL